MDERRNPDGSRYYEVQEIQSRHREIMRLVLMGLSNAEIAAQLGVTPQNVSDVKNSSICREHLSGLQDQRDDDAVKIGKQLEALLPDAIAVYERILKEEGDLHTKVTPMQLFKVAGDVQDRTGHGKITKIVSQTSSMHLTTADLDEVKGRAEAKRRAEASGLMVTVPFEESEASSPPADGHPITDDSKES